MKKLIAVAQAVVLAAVISTLAIGADQVINYDEAMVGRNHPTLPDTLNRGFLIQHDADGTHQDNIIAPGKLRSSSGTAGATTYYRGDGAWGTPVATSLPWDNITRTLSSGVTDTELSYVDNVTSAIQTQLNAKQASNANLTYLAAPTAWRLFYSNGSSAMTQLSFGASGTFLRSNGASSAPTFDTPSGSGDMLASIYDVNSDNVVDTAAALAAQYIDWNSGSGGSSIANKPTTIAGYGITDNLSALISLPWDNIISTPTTLAGYGITDAASAVTSLPWDNITSPPALNSLPISTTVLNNPSNYPTFNQSTTGNAATATLATTATTATTATALSAQYIDWSQSSGATSVANRPTINGVAVTGAVLDNASNYPTFNQATTGNADTATTATALSGQYIDWSQSSGATSVANRPTINSIAVTGAVLDNASNYPVFALGTGTSGNYVSDVTAGGFLKLTGTEGATLGLWDNCAENQIPKWNGAAWACAADASGEAGGNPAFDNVESGTNTSATMTVGTGGTLTFSGSGVVNASQYRGITAVDNNEFSYLDGATSGLQGQIDGKQATITDNSITPARLQYGSGTAGATTFYRGDGAWVVPTDTDTIVTSLPWDNISSRPTINSVTVSAAVLDNVSNYPAGLERTANKGTDNTLGTSDTVYPSQKAVKQYVDGVAAGKQTLDVDLTSIAGGITGIVKGAGNGAGYSAAVSGVDYQAVDADLTTLASPTAWRLYYSGASGYSALAFGDADLCLKSGGASSAPAWGDCGTGGGSTTSLPWDNITSRPTINSVTVTGAVLDNASNYPAELARVVSPTFTGTVTIPTPFTLGATSVTATGTQLNYLDATSSIQGQLDAKAPLVSPSFTTPTLGVATATSLNTGQGANLLYGMDQSVKTTDNVVFASITTDEWITTCLASDNTCGIGLGNQTDPTGQYLDAAYLWFNTTSNMTKVRNGDNTATLEVMTSGAAHTLNFATTGTLSGAIMILDNVAAPTAAQTYGSLNIVNAAITVTLPPAASGMSMCILSVAAAAVSVDVDGSDVIYLNGVALDAGDKITSASAAGDFICLVSSGTTNWYTLGRSGTWTDGGA